MIRELLRRLIYWVAPYAIHDAVNQKARARILEKRLNRILEEYPETRMQSIGEIK